MKTLVLVGCLVALTANAGEEIRLRNGGRVVGTLTNYHPATVDVVMSNGAVATLRLEDIVAERLAGFPGEVGYVYALALASIKPKDKAPYDPFSDQPAPKDDPFAVSASFPKSVAPADPFAAPEVAPPNDPFRTPCTLAYVPTTNASARLTKLSAPFDARAQTAPQGTSGGLRNAAPPQQVPPDVMAVIRRKAATDWPDNFNMQQYQIGHEAAAWLNINAKDCGALGR